MINVATAQLEYIDGYGLKDFSTGAGVDIVDDEQCTLFTNSCLFLARRPDGIATFELDGVDYVITADEGSDFDIGNDDNEWSEVVDSEELFLMDGTFPFSGMSFNGDPTCLENFRQGCVSGTVEGGWCSNFEVLISPGVVDYSSGFPIMNKVVGIGGRGMSIFSVGDNGISFVWDSASDFESETCANFPWAGNALQDEDFAPVNGPRWTLSGSDDRDSINERNDIEGCDFPDGTRGACPMGQTLDERAQADGLAVEAVTVGVACNSLIAIACGENNGMCLMYDISTVRNPTLVNSFNLSPVSETMNPEQTYNDTLGDVDPETSTFIPREESPTGCSGVIFGGAISGTLSFYEFICENGERDCVTNTSGASSVNIGFSAAGLMMASLILAYSL